MFIGLVVLGGEDLNYPSVGAYAFREIHEEDLPMLLEWRNSPRVHSMMLTDHVITWEEHKSWFRRIKDEAREGFFIFTFNGEPVGYSCPGGAYIGAPDKCPKDAGIVLFFMSTDQTFARSDVTESNIVVFADNENALRLNKFLGYEFDRAKDYCVTKDGKQRAVMCGVLTRERWIKRRAEIVEMLQLEE